jgi:hypothetical protein
MNLIEAFESERRGEKLPRYFESEGKNSLAFLTNTVPSAARFLALLIDILSSVFDPIPCMFPLP